MAHEDFLPNPPVTLNAPHTSVLASLGTAPYPITLADAGLGPDYAPDYHRLMRIHPELPSTVPGYPPSPYVSPQEKARQALMRTARDFEEKLQNRGWQERIADLEVQLAQKDVQMAQKDVRLEQLQRELYELQLLSHTCEICHFAFNKKREDGKLEIIAIKSTRVCSATIGDPNCAKRQKADSVAERRAEQKRTDQIALNDYESTGN